MNGFIEIKDTRGIKNLINTKYIVCVNERAITTVTEITLEGEIHIRTSCRYEKVIEMIRSADNGCN